MSTPTTAPITVNEIAHIWHTCIPYWEDKEAALTCSIHGCMYLFFYLFMYIVKVRKGFLEYHGVLVWAQMMLLVCQSLPNNEDQEWLHLPMTHWNFSCTFIHYWYWHSLILLWFCCKYYFTGSSCVLFCFQSLSSLHLCAWTLCSTTSFTFTMNSRLGKN